MLAHSATVRVLFGRGAGVAVVDRGDGRYCTGRCCLGTAGSLAKYCTPKRGPRDGGSTEMTAFQMAAVREDAEMGAMLLRHEASVEVVVD